MHLSHKTIRKGGVYRHVNIKGMKKDVLLTLYRQMLRLRRIEEALQAEYHPADEMRCPVHFCEGQESVPAALSQIVQKDDYMFSHHRSHGYYFAKNAPMRELFAEIYGKATGASGGRAGSQDIAHTPTRFFSGAILAGALGIATGVAYGLKMRKSPQIVFCGFGEACTEEGAFWEAINFAAAKKLPVLFACENNRYSTFSDQLVRVPDYNLSKRVSAFGVRSIQLFGNDVVKVYKTAKEEVQNIRKGKGPVFLENFTYRWCSHVGPEDDNWNHYRPKGELEFWKKNCPIVLLEAKLAKARILTPQIKEEMEKTIAAEIAECFKFAKEGPFPKAGDWKEMNENLSSEVADRLLKYAEAGDFDHDQADTKIVAY